MGAASHSNKQFDEQAGRETHPLYNTPTTADMNPAGASDCCSVSHSVACVCAHLWGLAHKHTYKHTEAEILLLSEVSNHFHLNSIDRGCNEGLKIQMRLIAAVE